MDASTWIALGSLIISGIAVVLSRRANRRSNDIADEQKDIASEQRDLNERLVEIEEEREEARRRGEETAQVEAIHRSPPGKNRKDLIVVNHGPANAKDVEVGLKGAQQNEFFDPSEEGFQHTDTEMPFDLAAGAQEVWWLSSAVRRPWKVKLAWTDGRGRRERETTLS